VRQPLGEFVVVVGISSHTVEEEGDRTQRRGRRGGSSWVAVPEGGEEGGREGGVT
jgi:hypothetical protein